MEGLQRIEEDLFDIAHRLREVDARYELYRNRKLNRFEIHACGALQIAVPFDRLDARTVELARKTRVERARNILEDMERHNAKLKETEQKRAREKILMEVESIL